MCALGAILEETIFKVEFLRREEEEIKAK